MSVVDPVGQRPRQFMETRVLIVDDTPDERLIAGAIVERQLGWKIAEADHGRQALGLLEKGGVDVVVTDLQMPELDGLELVDAIRSRFPNVPVILMTAYGSEQIAIQALQRGAASYVPKK